jgi:hypothetical protein
MKSIVSSTDSAAARIMLTLRVAPRYFLAVIRQSPAVDSLGIDFPQASRVARIRRDRYDSDDCIVSKEFAHAVTSLKKEKASAESLAGSPAASGASSPSTGSATPSETTKTQIPDTPEMAPRSWPRCGTSPSACSTSPA